MSSSITTVTCPNNISTPLCEIHPIAPSVQKLARELVLLFEMGTLIQSITRVSVEGVFGDGIEVFAFDQIVLGKIKTFNDIISELAQSMVCILGIYCHHRCANLFAFSVTISKTG